MTRRIVLGVTGGIAAYKAVEVCRRLVDEGAHVVPVLTEEATRFIGEVTFSALASEPVRKSLFDDADPIPHTHLGQEADLIVVAPATARFIGSYAAGISDGLLLATVLATRAPVLVCPAMHTEMWEHPAAQENLATLRRRGVHIVPPATGRLAGGDQGEGRLADIDDIVSAALGLLSGDMVGISVLVSAGGTREPIDPVRVITNRSSGKQGHAIAAAAAARGGSVILVTTADQPVYPGIEVVRVDTAAEMEEVMTARALESDVVIMVAAVADFRPKEISEQKLSKADGPPELILEPTPDILSSLVLHRRSGQVIVGFAAETREALSRATAKMKAKGVDLMVVNDVSAPLVGFDHETNEVVLLGDDGSAEQVPLTSKRQVAEAVLDKVMSRLIESRGQYQSRSGN